jgi:hypothetical protein
MIATACATSRLWLFQSRVVSPAPLAIVSFRGAARAYLAATSSSTFLRLFSIESFAQAFAFLPKVPET